MISFKRMSCRNSITFNTDLPRNSRLKTLILVCHITYLLLERGKGLSGAFERSINLTAASTISVSPVRKRLLPELRFATPVRFAWVESVEGFLAIYELVCFISSIRNKLL